eukprot:403340574
MDITRENFIELLPLIRHSINSADFIAYDTEFSGLSIGFDDKGHEYDTVEDRYQKLVHNCSRMNTFQVGLCTFRWIPEKMKYVCRPFNFYVFPDSSLFEDINIQFQASNIKFLTDNHFDFNKLFTQGISYQRLSKRDEVYRRAMNRVSEEKQHNRFYTHLGDSSQAQLIAIMEQVEKFIADTKDSGKNEQLVLEVKSHALKRQLSRDLQNKYKELGNIYCEFKKGSDQFSIKKWWKKNDYSQRNNQQSGKKATGSQANSAQKINPEVSKNEPGQQQPPVKDIAEFSVDPSQLIQSTQIDTSLDSKLSLDIIDQVKQEEEKKIEDQQELTEEEKAKLLKQKEFERLFTYEMGFSLVVEDLMKAKKPIIGHNMIYDICYLYNQFIDKLPNEYSDFIKIWNEQFPYIYDTKVLSNAAEYFGRTDLGKVYEKCTNDPKLKSQFRINFDLQGGFGNYDGAAMLAHYHEAAYDAYMTGVAFVNIVKYKEVERPKEEKKENRGGDRNQRGGHYRGGRGGKPGQQNNRNQKNEEGKIQASVGQDQQDQQDPSVKQEVPAQEQIQQQQQIDQLTEQISQIKLDDSQQNKVAKQNQEEEKSAFENQEEVKVGAVANKEEEKKEVPEKKWTPIDFNCNFAIKYLNKVMFNQFDSGRLYHLDPARQEDVAKDWSNVAWIQVEPELEDMRADQLSHKLGQYGDFAIVRDSKNSFYLEFFYLEPNMVQSQDIDGFIQALNEGEKMKELGFKHIVPYQEAVKFRAHNRFDMTNGDDLGLAEQIQQLKLDDSQQNQVPIQDQDEEKSAFENHEESKVGAVSNKEEEKKEVTEKKWTPIDFNQDVAKDWSNVAWIQVEPELEDMRADQLSHKLGQYGDFAIVRDFKNSFYLELFYLEPNMVQRQDINGFIQASNEGEKMKELGFKHIVPYQEAVKFRAHNRFEYI